jgi:hypothetical protein
MARDPIRVADDVETYVSENHPPSADAIAQRLLR